MIEDYDFGSIKVNGKTYVRDIKIIDGEVIPDWWRIEGHELAPADIEDIMAARPDVLVVGTGHTGLMRVLAETRAALSDLDIELIASPTARAVSDFNRLCKSRKAAFAAHLTC